MNRFTCILLYLLLGIGVFVYNDANEKELEQEAQKKREKEIAQLKKDFKKLSQKLDSAKAEKRI